MEERRGQSACHTFAVLADPSSTNGALELQGVGGYCNMRALRGLSNLARSLPPRSLVTKGRVSPALHVPSFIAPPPYVKGGPPPPPVQKLEVKDAKYAGIREIFCNT